MKAAFGFAAGTGLPPGSVLPLIVLALGAFAVGTEAFMLAGLLPTIAADLSVSLAAAGQFVTVFSLAYAVSSPILTTLGAGLDRRSFLIGALACFTAANCAACIAPSYGALMAVRVLQAVSAGLYMPSANALAGALVPPTHRGRALALVNAGVTLAVAFGVPLGAWTGQALGWRATFAGIGVLSALVTIGVALGLPQAAGGTLPVPTLAQRTAVARRPEVLVVLLVTTLWAAGIWTIYPYLAPFLAVSAGISGADVGAVLLFYGLMAAIGVFIGGRMTDRFGSQIVLRVCLVAMAVSYANLSAGALLEQTSARIVILAAVAVWGVAGWAFYPAQQAHVIATAGLGVAPIALSFNASCMYLGFALGAGLGSVIVTDAVTRIGFAGALCELAALAVTLLAGNRRLERYRRDNPS